MRFLLILFAVTVSLSYTPPGISCNVDFNGIYTASVDKETDAHIRFYPDKTVIVSTSVKNIKDVKTWFTRDNIDKVLSGKYKIKGCNLSFTVKGETGSQKFSGQIQQNNLVMTITDGKTKATTSRTYTFIAI
jgi:hypothetical protein